MRQRVMQMTIGRVHAWLAIFPPPEKRVLVSMAYNGFINKGKSDALLNAITKGDRAKHGMNPL